MVQLTNDLLEQLIDCREEDMPSQRVVHMMASEIMRIRGYGEMIPAPNDELKQRAITLLSAIRENERIQIAFETLSDAMVKNTKIESYTTILDTLSFVVGNIPLGNDKEWVEISKYLLQDIERVINDAVGFGKSHSASNHNNALNSLRKYIQNSGNSAELLVPRAFLRKMETAVDEIVYGSNISQSYRESIVHTLKSILDESDGTPENKGEESSS